MVNTSDRGDYTVGFKANKDGFDLTLTPSNLDAEHRSFYADEDGVIHGDEPRLPMRRRRGEVGSARLDRALDLSSQAVLDSQRDPTVRPA